MKILLLASMIFFNLTVSYGADINKRKIFFEAAKQYINENVETSNRYIDLKKILSVEKMILECSNFPYEHLKYEECIFENDIVRDQNDRVRDIAIFAGGGAASHYYERLLDGVDHLAGRMYESIRASIDRDRRNRERESRNNETIHNCTRDLQGGCKQ